ncbi:hypothetical protein DBR42_22920 [Pelomonas sp. HMWF004]|nr:hypothetical protein DBR42_22920 [Pelomonas sp. HMWF004]
MDGIDDARAYWLRVDAYAEAHNAGFRSGTGTGSVPPMWRVEPVLSDAFHRGRAERLRLDGAQNPSSYGVCELWL